MHTKHNMHLLIRHQRACSRDKLTFFFHRKQYHHGELVLHRNQMDKGKQLAIRRQIKYKMQSIPCKFSYLNPKPQKAFLHRLRCLVYYVLLLVP